MQRRQDVRERGRGVPGHGRAGVFECIHEDWGFGEFSMTFCGCSMEEFMN